ncbi:MULTISPECIES: hypothetical protein [Acetobacteraceae]|uniref:Uncharacterized protein n=1 Tax=Komagataeibacter europaeus NBRC 3261 TaxID=1234669 RepID=A0A0D6Q1L5_KOMEU|nr:MULTISPECIES: hypothetical protein [Acetobacteraceae]GAN96676.1 hypothetical protein Geu3261_0090_022 [Komagataeibacter europaeus NBRC 3261]
MKQDFTPIPAGELVGLLSVKDQAAAINVHRQFRMWFTGAEVNYDQNQLQAARSAVRAENERMEDLERIIMRAFMAEGPEIEAITFRRAQAGRVQS